MAPSSQHRVKFKVVGEFAAAESVLHSAGGDSGLFRITSQVHGSWERESLCLNKQAIDSRTTALVKIRPKPEKKSQSDPRNKSALSRDLVSHEHRSSNTKLSYPVHPLTILQKGNSDPFSTYAIPIKAETNETLLFYESNILPLLVACMEANGVSASAGKASWHDPFSSLEDKCAAYGLLARTAVVMSRSAEPGSRLAVKSLVYKKKTSELLRARLKSGEQDLVVSQVCPIVVSMLITAVFEDAFEEAAIHVKMLKYLLYTHSSRVGKEVDLGTLFTILWYDFHRASKALTRPIFDFGGWVAEQFLPGWQQALKDLPALSGQAERSLDGTMGDEKLRDLFITMREIVEILAMVTSDPSITTPSTQISIAQWMIVCQGQLIDRYVDVMDAMDTNSPISPGPVASFEHNWSCYTVAYLSLAALWWTRCLEKMENAPTAPSTTIFNGNIIPSLRAALIQSDLLSDGLDALIYGRVRLWALYVGALAEQRAGRALKMRRPGFSAEESWFTKELLLQARRMDILVWSDLRKVLQGFLYSDSLEPHGSTWFTSG
jgi:hypothetical protein